ncbi:phosphoribosylformylglycinamidine synthase subunit PurL [Halobacteriales archaeon QS_8_69_26]|nr:MAG: phosphoribosylformylglycinamidine synthase subunit PurL [Halobacteriales archaeon QS_8_69_26]
MPLSDADRALVVEELDREPTREEAALFENLWSEHCAYRSSRPLLSAFESDGEAVLVGPGDDAAVVRVAEDLAIAVGIESHNHPSYVDPYDGAATGVGGIVRDIMSMGAYPVALADCLYFGPFEDEYPRYLFEGVVEGISDYGNAIGVPTVGGSVTFHEGYEGNPLVNVGCVGLVEPDRIVRAAVQEPGNRLVLVGNATGRDGLGGASFASEDLDEDAETEDRPAVQVGDPYAEKLLIEANEQLLDEGLVRAARDLGAAGLGGATSEMAAQGGLGARIDLDAVHQREPGMNALEILLAESQERMCYEVRPADVDRVRAVADRFDLGCSVIGEVTEGRYVCTFSGSEGGANGDPGEASDPETVVDVPAGFLADGAPTNDLGAESPPEPETDRPEVALREAVESVLGSPTTASKEWVYRQYDHEVGVRTAVGPGDDAAILALREAGLGLALAAGGHPRWTDANAYEGARAVALEVATNLAAKGATPLAAVDCLNGGNPETPAVYGGFRDAVNGLADGCAALDVPVVGGNVSLYNDSASGPVPPTPTLLMVGTREGYDAPPASPAGEGRILLVGGHATGLGGSEYLAQCGGSDRFPDLPAEFGPRIDALAGVADQDATLAVHDVSHGGLAVTLAEMVTGDAGVRASVPDKPSLLAETPGRAVVETTDPGAVRAAFEGVAPVTDLGTATGDGVLSLDVGGEDLDYAVEEIRDLRGVIDAEM